MKVSFIIFIVNTSICIAFSWPEDYASHVRAIVRMNFITNFLIKVHSLVKWIDD